MSVTGIFDLPADAYHAGPGLQTCLSASIAHILCTRSPLHAYTAHPRLNPNYQRVEEDKFNLGHVAHAMLLEGRDVVYVCQYDSWRSNEAKEAKEYARSMGRVPLLAHHLADCEAMVAAVQEKLAALQIPMFVDGQAERTLFWEEDGIFCKARLDWLRDDFTGIRDLKTTSRSAHPAAFARRLYDLGADIQAAMYIRGVEAVTGVKPDFVWCVVETAPPYELALVAPGQDVLTLGEAKFVRALDIWRECLDRGEWPGYERRVAVAEMPPYEEARWLEREAREEMAA